MIKYIDKKIGLIMNLLLSVITVLSLLELFKYDGFIQTHLFIKIEFLYLLYSILLIYFLFIKRKQNNFSLKYTKLSISGLTVATLLSYLVFNLIEYKNYTNYVLVHYHIALSVLPKIFIFSFLIFLIVFLENDIFKKTSSFIGHYVVKEKSTSYINIMIFGIVFALLIYNFLLNIASITSYITKNLFIIMAFPTASYDNKMNIKLKDYYMYMKFVATNTPKDAIIFVPPATPPWEYFGNFALDRYFLYPRQLEVYGSSLRINSDTCTMRQCYVMVLKRSNPPNIWPQDKFEGKNVIYFNINTNYVSESSASYDPVKETIYENWGLIKI